MWKWKERWKVKWMSTSVGSIMERRRPWSWDIQYPANYTLFSQLK